MSLLFLAAELRREIQSIGELARDFLDGASQRVLATAEEDLSQICESSGDRSYAWTIQPKFPVRTVGSDGEFMPDKKGGALIHGEITFVWELRPERTPGNTQAAKLLRLSGNASTMVRILEGPPAVEPESELAMWRMEVADDNGPGAYFHVQVYGREDDQHFPHMVDVPRLPGSLVSPFACMEFVLGELFQDRWAEHADRDFRDVRDWRSVQSSRLLHQLKWHSEVVATGSGSPWSAWKKAKPPEDLFT